MSYSIYKSLSNDEFLKLKNSLNSLEAVISDLLTRHQFHLNEYCLNGDFLGLDYQSSIEHIVGNIGLKYGDERSANDFFFSFYVLKAYDNAGIRYYKREVPHKGNIALSVLKREYRFYVDSCINMFHSWTLNDLTDEIKLL